MSHATPRLATLEAAVSQRYCNSVRLSSAWTAAQAAAADWGLGVEGV